MEVTPLPRQRRKTRQTLIPAARQRGALAHLPRSFCSDLPPSLLFSPASSQDCHYSFLLEARGSVAMSTKWMERMLETQNHMLTSKTEMTFSHMSLV